MEKAHDGRALTNSFMQGLSVCYTMNSTMCIRRLVCIKQSFFIWLIWYNLSKFYKNPLLEGEGEQYEIIELWRLKKASMIFKSNLPVHPQQWAAFSHWGFIHLHILCGIHVDSGSSFPETCVLSEHGWCGKRSGVCNYRVVTLSCFPVHHGRVGGEITWDTENPQMSPQFLVR